MKLMIHTPLKYFEFEGLPEDQIEECKKAILDVIYGIRGHLSMNMEGMYTTVFFSKEVVLQSVFMIKSEI